MSYALKRAVASPDCGFGRLRGLSDAGGGTSDAECAHFTVDSHGRVRPGASCCVSRSRLLGCGTSDLHVWRRNRSSSSRRYCTNTAAGGLRSRSWNAESLKSGFFGRTSGLKKLLPPHFRRCRVASRNSQSEGKIWNQDSTESPPPDPPQSTPSNVSLFSRLTGIVQSIKFEKYKSYFSNHSPDAHDSHLQNYSSSVALFPPGLKAKFNRFLDADRVNIHRILTVVIAAFFLFLSFFVFLKRIFLKRTPVENSSIHPSSRSNPLEPTPPPQIPIVPASLNEIPSVAKTQASERNGTEVLSESAKLPLASSPDEKSQVDKMNSELDSAVQDLIIKGDVLENVLANVLEQRLSEIQEKHYEEINALRAVAEAESKLLQEKLQDRAVIEKQMNQLMHELYLVKQVAEYFIDIDSIRDGEKRDASERESKLMEQNSRLELKSKNDDMEKERLQMDVMMYLNDNSNLQRQINKVTAESEVISKKLALALEALELSSKEREAERKSMAESLSTSEMELERARFEIQQKQKEIADFTAEMQKWHSEVSVLKEEVIQLKAVVAELKFALEESENEEERLEEEVRSLRQRAANAERTVGTLEAGLSALKAQMIAREVSRNKERERLKILASETANLAAELNRTKKEASTSEGKPNSVESTSSLAAAVAPSTSSSSVSEVVRFTDDGSVIVNTDDEGGESDEGDDENAFPLQLNGNRVRSGAPSEKRNRRASRSGFGKRYRDQTQEPVSGGGQDLKRIGWELADLRVQMVQNERRWLDDQAFLEARHVAELAKLSRELENAVALKKEQEVHVAMLSEEIH